MSQPVTSQICPQFEILKDPRENGFLKIACALVIIQSLGLVIAGAGFGFAPIYISYIWGGIGLISAIAFAALFGWNKEGCILDNSYSVIRDVVKQQIKQMNPDELLVSFYTGNGKDTEGRTFEAILNWDNDLLEEKHDFIQWLFPLFDRSYYNKKSPILNIELLNTLKNSKAAQQRLLQAFELMLRFYGLEYDEEKNLVRESQSRSFWESRRKNWISRDNHNYKRITRILKSLAIMGRQDLALAFYRTLIQIQTLEPKISNETLSYWHDAAVTVY